MSKPRVLVLGGVGFIGRNFVEYLVKNDLCSFIRVVDKVLPATAQFSAEHNEIFTKVDYLQRKLNDSAHVEAAFHHDGGKFNCVFNLAAETRYGQDDQVYNELVYDISVKCALQAAKSGVDRYIEVSTAQVYAADKKPKKEDAKLDPWTSIAKFKLKGENEIKKIPGLNYIIVRPAIVYGPGDKSGLAPRVVTGAVYKYLNEKMKFLYDGELRLNTVHVRDVAKALFHLAQHGKVSDTYNLADKNDTDQQKINVLLEKIYGIKTGYTHKMASLMINVSLKMVTEQVNDKHVQPWVAMCKEESINYTPLSPYLDPELLTDKSLTVDGSHIEVTGFKYDYPDVTENHLKEIIDYYLKQNLFPKSVFK